MQNQSNGHTPEEPVGLDLKKLFAQRNNNEPITQAINEDVEADSNNAGRDSRPVPENPQKPENQDDEDGKGPETEDNEDDQESKKPERVNRIKELEEAKKKIEISERRYKDTAKSYNDLTRKVSSFGKIVKKYVADSILTEDEAAALLENTKYEELEAEDQTPYQKHARLWREAIPQIRKFSKDPDKIMKDAHAFDQLLRDSTDEELEEIWEKFEELGDDPAESAWLMLKMGEKHWDDGFDEVYEAGSIKNFKHKMSETIQELKKSLDEKDQIILKLKKKHEDYTPANLGVPQGGSSKSSATREDAVSTKEMFAKRNNNIKFG